MDPVRLTAGAVVLRPHRKDDIDGILDQSLDPESQRWTSIPVPYTRQHAEEFVETIIPAGWRDGSYLAFAIADPASDEYLGTLDIRLKGAGGGEIGFGLRPRARGKGAMTAAVRTLVDWAFDAGALGLDVVHWRAHIGNWLSRRVAWRVGFQIGSAVRGLCVSRGQRYDGWIGSLRPRDPREPTSPWYDVPTLRGERCVLRRFRETDVDAVVEGCTDPLTRHWLSALPDPYTNVDALGYIQSREEDHASGQGIYWAAADPATDRCVGSFGLMDIDRTMGSGEIGYWVHPGARGRGVATEATRMIIRHAAIPVEDGGLGLRLLTLRAAATNTASQLVAERAGFRRAGTWRADQRLGDGTFDDLVGFDLLTSEISSS
ncbi:GNAT family N-acetyltransferase [Actinopolymorpha alba]|uniref:GNAT family N-acetyltransferase n=1 Tax=Actinopolymorpha alba TaxID=533267 RepID=UPI000369644A|nr:GNAT family N-acetyltransferase [Actinopolymorpha alba]